MQHSTKLSFLVLTFGLTVLFLGQNDLQVEARAYFVFGDSLVDNGNNNFLLTSARADSPPYGIDSPNGRPSGRFSNSRNLADLVGESLGLSQVLPYLNPQLNGEGLLEGANFASAGVGILNDTGIQFVNIIRIVTQFQLFEQYQLRVGALIGEEQATCLVNEAVVLITLGGNDFVNNYFLVPFSARSRQFRIPDYVRYLIKEYRKILRRLYDLGARRVIVTGTGPIGCVPAEIAQRGRNGKCAVELQQAAGLFNPQLVQTVQDLNSELGSVVFISANAFDMSYTFITDPAAFGFVTSNVACCGQGPYNGIGFCTPVSNLCPDRDLYAFWDAFHPTDRANQLIVEQFMIGSNNVMNPRTSAPCWHWIPEPEHIQRYEILSNHNTYSGSFCFPSTAFPSPSCDFSIKNETFSCSPQTFSASIFEIISSESKLHTILFDSLSCLCCCLLLQDCFGGPQRPYHGTRRFNRSFCLPSDIDMNPSVHIFMYHCF